MMKESFVADLHAESGTPEGGRQVDRSPIGTKSQSPDDMSLLGWTALATVIPAAKALSRVGLSPWWSILSVVPVVGWFGLWAFAYARWPKVDPTRAHP